MLTISPEKREKSTNNQKIVLNKSGIRGNIYDSNGFLIATTIRKYDLVINPSILRSPENFSKQLDKIFNKEIFFIFIN